MTSKHQHIVMLAAENDIIPGAKVGGIGDVIRDIPKALAGIGQQVDVVIPSYGLFHELPTAVASGSVIVNFRNREETIEIFELYRDRTPGVRYWVLEHSLFSVCGRGKVYCNDPADAPFASDANKFALFSVAACKTITSGIYGDLDAIHCHDWHTAFVPILRAYDPTYAALKHLRCVFSMHNLAIQGIRPFHGSESSLENWFPTLQYAQHEIADPRWSTCVNPMVAAINLSDVVHTVSKSYADEIQQADAIFDKGFHGGEGLEAQIANVAASGRLTGILNGCDYDLPDQTRSDWSTIKSELNQTVLSWIASGPTMASADFLADRTLQAWQGQPEPKHIITSVGRLTEQKVRLLTYTNQDGKTALDRILESLSDRGVFILLGTGDPDYEQFLARTAAKYNNFLFLNRYAQTAADLLYTNGTLFLMPSSFEPCGISQMLSMKQSQPCLVHAVGGLKDTVKDQTNGFHFSGETFEEQGEDLLNTFKKTLQLREEHPVRWQAICRHAGEARFLWEDSARQYTELLYGADRPVQTG